jgi:hypothetical protein
MAESETAADPTYRVDKDDETTTYTCLIPDAGKPDALCGHQATDLDLFTQHMMQRHAGVMIPEPAPKGDRAAQAAVRQAKAQVAEKQAEAAKE